MLIYSINIVSLIKKIQVLNLGLFIGIIWDKMKNIAFVRSIIKVFDDAQSKNTDCLDNLQYRSPG